MNNYEYSTEFVLEAAKNYTNISVLDYGYGAGQIVAALREKGINAFGCDVFYEGGDYSKSVPDGMFGIIMRKTEDAW